MTDIYGKCPTCGEDWDEGLIVDNFKRQRSKGVEFWQKSDEEIEKMVNELYSPPYRFSKLILVKVMDTRESYYKCPNCNSKF